jgi:hypothetical protein
MAILIPHPAGANEALDKDSFTAFYKIEKLLYNREGSFAIDAWHRCTD